MSDSGGLEQELEALASKLEGEAAGLRQAAEYLRTIRKHNMYAQEIKRAKEWVKRYAESQ